MIGLHTVLPSWLRVDFSVWSLMPATEPDEIKYMLPREKSRISFIVDSIAFAIAAVGFFLIFVGYTKYSLHYMISGGIIIVSTILFSALLNLLTWLDREKT